MKVFFTLLLLVAGEQSFAQQLIQVPVDATTHLVSYSAIVETPHITQADLLTRTRVWANGATVPGKPPLVLSEQGTDVVMVVASQSVNNSYFNTSNVPRALYYTATIALREGRYQYRLTNFVIETADATTHPNPTIEPAESAFLTKNPPRADGISYEAHVRKTFEEAIVLLIASIQNTLTTNAIVGKDW